MLLKALLLITNRQLKIEKKKERTSQLQIRIHQRKNHHMKLSNHPPSQMIGNSLEVLKKVAAT